MIPPDLPAASVEGLVAALKAIDRELGVVVAQSHWTGRDAVSVRNAYKIAREALAAARPGPEA